MKPNEKYNEAIALTTKKKYTEAFVLFDQATKSRLGKAANKMFSIYKNHLENPSTEITEQLLGAFITGFDGGHNSKETLDTAITNLTVLERQIEASNLLLGKLHWALAICYTKRKRTHDQTNALIKSAMYGNSDSLQCLIDHIETTVNKNHLSRIYLKCYEYFSEEDPHKIQVLTILLTLLHKKELKKIERFGLSQDSEAITEFDSIEMQQRIANYYNYLILNGHGDENLLAEALNWFATINEQDDDLIQAIDDYLQNNDTNLLLALNLGKYYFNNKQYTKAQQWMESLFQADEYSDELKEYQQMLRAIYQNSNCTEGINRLEDWIKENSIGDILFQQTQQANYPGDELWRYIDDLERSAMHKHEAAMAQISAIANNSAYALAAKADILEKIGKNIADAKKVCTTFDYHKQASLDKMRTSAKKTYEEDIKGGNPLAYFEVAKLRYEGKLFAKNSYLARELFAKAWAMGLQQANYYYAKMCFYGEGGAVDIETAEQHLAKDSSSADINYLLGEIYYWRYLQAELENNEQKNMFLQQAKNYFLRAANNNSKAFLSLIIMRDRDNCNDLDAPIQTLMQSKQKYAKLISPDTKLKETDQAYFAHALELMNTKNDSSKMRKIAASNNEYRNQACLHLHEFYQDKILNLVSTYCYECKRHGENSPDSALLLNIITEIDSRFADFKLEDFVGYLEKEEEKTGDYFDENISDDSDDEREDNYQRTDGHVTADHPRTKELVDKLEEKLQKTLKKLAQNKYFKDDKKYNEFVAEIKNLFSDVEIVSYKPKRPRTPAAKAAINEDLATINYYATQNNLEQALKLTSYDFYVAQSRGLHFQIPAWSQPMRQNFRKKVVDGNHPFCDEPLYSTAVYEHAGITDFTDLSELTKLRLEKSDRLIYSRLMQTRNTSPLENVSEKYSTLAHSYQYRTLNHQLQRIYSERQSAFHDIIKELAPPKHSFFANDRNPYVSTADIESSHSGRYAYCLKSFAGHENDRLLPDWDNTGRAHHPHSGVIILSLHPLSDYAHNDHNHLASMNTKGELMLEDLMTPERETTFFSHIKKDRIKFIVVARYPSFHHEQYLKTFHHLYGLNEQMYYLFQKQILSTKPHTRKRELLRLLLGEYLCAYQKLFLMRKAYDKVGDDVLLYRDRYGNFSLTPIKDVSATPNGLSESNSLRRYHTHKIREPKRTNSANSRRAKRNRSPEADPESSDHASKQVRLSTRGNC